MQKNAFHEQKPQTRHTIKGQTVTLFLTSAYVLSIRPKYAKHPYTLDAVAVLRLANLMHDEYAGIVTEARKHNGVEKPGCKGEDHSWSNWH